MVENNTISPVFCRIFPVVADLLYARMVLVFFREAQMLYIYLYLFL